MSLQVEKLEKNMAKLTIEVSAEELEKAIEGAYQKNKNKISIPGFRKGKAPRKMIEQMYGKSVFYEDAANALIPDAYDKALEECEEQIVSSPKIDVTQLEAGKPFIFTAEVALKPEVTLGKYKGVKVDKIDVKVSDEDIDAEINRERESNARTISVEDRAVKDGDMTVIDFEGFVDGVAFEGGKGENFDLELGSGSFVPGFEDQVIGMKAGEEKDIDITFPENYTPELAGKPVVFHVKVNEVKAKDVPAIDDEFAKDVSEFDTLKELKADLKKKITEEREKAAQRAFEDALMQKVADGIEADIPDAMIDLQCEKMVDSLKQQLASQGIPFDQYLKMVQSTEEAVKAEAKEPAQQQVRMDLAIEALIKAEGIDATEEEIEAETKKVAEQYGMDLEMVKKYLPADQVKEQVVREKVIKLVADSATATAPVVETKNEEKKAEAEKTEEK